MASNHDECVRPDIPLMEFVREFLLYDRKKARLARLQYCIITPIFMHAHCMMVWDVGLRINLVLFCQEDSLAIRRISFSCSEKRQCATLGVCWCLLKQIFHSELVKIWSPGMRRRTTHSSCLDVTVCLPTKHWRLSLRVRASNLSVSSR